MRLAAFRHLVPFLLLSSPFAAASTSKPSPSTPAPKPLYRDPIHDGAADPVVIWNPHVQRWWMFYTNRRANVPHLSGVAWVHGTPIGIAESSDNGTTWSHLGVAHIDLPASLASTEPTLWAPHVLSVSNPERNLLGYTSPAASDAPGVVHHMFLTVVPGVFEDWRHPRSIVHLTSTDLRTWSNPRPLALASDRVIDACVFPLPSGGWRLWYNNERDRKSIYHADSPDLVTWTDRGKTTGVGDRPGEGPYVFRWRGRNWMIVDLWKGLGVYHSPDLENWTPQAGDLLAAPGRGPDDGVIGGHACVIVNEAEDRAFLFYFTHPGRTSPNPPDPHSRELRRSSLQVVELREEHGVLTCDRDSPTFVRLR